MNKKYLLIILFLYLLFRIPKLGEDISNTDSYRWHTRSENFLNALKQGDLNRTYQHYQPGVTLMWLNAFVKQVSFSFQYILKGEASPATLENADYFPILHKFSKMAIISVLFSLLIIQIILL